jgi:hypothetical protein
MARKAYDERNRITTGDGRWFRISILWLSQMPIRASQELSWLSAMSGRGSIGHSLRVEWCIVSLIVQILLTIYQLWLQ